jgi:hypothetical protein
MRWIQQLPSNSAKTTIEIIPRTDAILSAIWGALKKNFGVTIEDALLNINTHMRKRAKVKREKLK